MVDEFIEELENLMRSNATGVRSDRLTLDYINIELKRYKNRKESSLLKTKKEYFDSNDSRNE